MAELASVKGNVYTTRSREATNALAGHFREQGRPYTVVDHRGRHLDTWHGEGTSNPTAPRNPGRGSPGATTSRLSAPAVGYTHGPGGFTQRLSALSVSGNTALGGSHFAFPRFGISDPVIDASGKERLLTQDFRTPDGGVVRERANLSADIPEWMAGLEHWNMNPRYWGSQFRTFASENPALTGAAAAVAASIGVSVGRNVGSAAVSGVRAVKSLRRPTVGFAPSPRRPSPRGVGIHELREFIPFM